MKAGMIQLYNSLHTHTEEGVISLIKYIYKNINLKSLYQHLHYNA